jgi:acetyl-CoA carboxylase carboxyltransferase component/biotin carboxyl carrier protein
MRGQVHRLTVSTLDRDRHRVELDGRTVDVEVDRLGPLETRLTAAGRRYPVVAVEAPGSSLVEVDGATHRVGRDVGGVVRAPAPAVVVAVRAAPGDDVEAGQPVVVLESMKMETAVRAPFAGRVREVRAVVNSQVDAGAPLLLLDRTGGDVEESLGERVALPGGDDKPDDDPRARALSLLEQLRALVTGYDVGAGHARRLVVEYAAARDELPPDDGQLLSAELDVLVTFADLAELSRNRPASEEEEADTQVHSPREHFHTYLHSLDVEREGLPEAFRARLQRALAHYGVTDLEPGPALEEAVHRVFLAQQRIAEQLPAVSALLDRWLTTERLPEGPSRTEVGEVLDRLVLATQLRHPSLGDLVRAVRFRHFEEPVVRAARQEVLDRAERLLEQLDEAGARGDTAESIRRMEALVASPEPLVRLLASRLSRPTSVPDPVLEVLTRRYYRSRNLEDVRSTLLDGDTCVTAGYTLGEDRLHLVALMTRATRLEPALAAVAGAVAGLADPGQTVVDLYVDWPDRPADADALSDSLRDVVDGEPTLRTARRVTVTACTPDGGVETLTFRPGEDGRPAEERLLRGLHPLTARRLDLWRLEAFDAEVVPSPEDTHLLHVTARDHPNDERFIALAEVRDLTPVRDERGEVVGFPTIERQLMSCLDGLRRAQSLRRSRRPLTHNRIHLYAWPSIEVPLAEVAEFARTAAPLTLGAGLDQIVLLARLQEEGGGPPRDVALRFSNRPGTGVSMTVTDRPTAPLRPLDDYTEKVLSARARGAPYPYELAPLLAGPRGSFVEHDLGEDGRLAPVERPPGQNRAGIVVGLVTTPTERYPEGMTRVALFGDPTKALGTVAEPECARVVAALDLAEERGIPVEWFALSSGARISMDSGTENMDWVSRALRRIIEFTQAGGEVNVVVTGINVGAQPYWNAEATMLMHTRGILVMTPDSAMVLTGKHSLDYSGGVSAEDNFGIGGHDRVMGPNGQAQYWAPDLTGALDVLARHYDHTYRAPGERWPRPAPTTDPRDRDVRTFPHTHPDSEFTTVGDVFSAEANPERKKAFDIRTVMRAVTDADHPVLERWAGMADADTAVVLDAHLGGHPVCVLGVESRPIPRRGSLPADGPDQWTAGTLFPRSSVKTARAINAASGNRPLVVLANLSGFDGSPESLRKWQLEYGAEIGRAITNFRGPIVFCVVSRYHGGAFVVFSGALNEQMEVLAVEGSYASVIGGAPAAAVVFSREVDRRTAADPRVKELEAAIGAADAVEQAHLRARLAGVRSSVRSEKLGEVAAEFEAVHDIERARRVGSVHDIVPAAELRPRLIAAVERGMERAAHV